MKLKEILLQKDSSLKNNNCKKKKYQMLQRPLMSQD